MNSRDMRSEMYAIQNRRQIRKREKRGWLFGQWRNDGFGDAGGNGAYGSPAVAVLFSCFQKKRKKLLEFLKKVT